MLPIAITAAFVLVLGPAMLAAIVFLQRRRLRSEFERRGFTSLDTDGADDGLQAPAYGHRRGRRRHTIGVMVDELLARWSQLR